MSNILIISAISILISGILAWKILSGGKSEFNAALREFRTNFFSDIKEWAKNPAAHQGLADFSGMDVLGAIFVSFIVFTFLLSIFIFAALFGLYHLLV